MVPEQEDSYDKNIGTPPDMSRISDLQTTDLRREVQWQPFNLSSLDFNVLTRKEMIHIIRLFSQKLSSANIAINDLTDVDATSGGSNAQSQIISQLQKQLKDKDNLLKLYYDKLSSEKDRYQSEINILKANNESLQKKLMKQMIKNKKGKISISSDLLDRDLTDKKEQESLSILTASFQSQKPND